MGCGASSGAGPGSDALEKQSAGLAGSAGAAAHAGADGQLVALLKRAEAAERRAADAEKSVLELRRQLEELRERQRPPDTPAETGAQPRPSVPARFDVYVSSAPEDSVVVAPYLRRFQDAGISFCSGPGPEGGMAASALFVCFISAASLASAACDAELRRAHELRRPKLPVFLAPPPALALSAEYRMILTSVNWTVQADASEAAAAAACDALLAGLRAHLAPPGASPVAPPTPREAGRREEPRTAPEEAGGAPTPSASHPSALPPFAPSEGPAGSGSDEHFDVFISYAHVDAAAVFAYVRALEAAGLSVWIDRQLVAGRRWMEDIANAMKRSRGFVCFLTPAYASSTNCDDEFQFCHHHLRLPKFPVFLADPTALRLRSDQQMMIGSGWRVVQEGPTEEAAAEGGRQLVLRIRAAFAEEARVAALRAAQAAAFELALADAARALAAAAEGEQRREAERWEALLQAGARKGGALLVDPRGAPHGVASLADAVAIAAPGETLLLAPGVYAERLFLEKDVALAGTRAAVVQHGDGAVVVCRGPAGPSVEGITIRGESGRHPAVRVRGGSRAVLADVAVWSAGNQPPAAQGAVQVEDDETAAEVRGCEIRGCARAAVVFTAGAKGLVEACRIADCGGDGIVVARGAAPRVARNVVRACKGSGVVVEEKAGGVVEENDLAECGRGGVELRTGATAEVRRNRIRACAFFGISAYVEARGTVEGNDISGHGRTAPAIQISKKADPLVRGNFVHDQMQGINVFAAGRGTIEGNVFERLGSAAHVAAGGVVVHRSEPVVSGNVVRDAAVPSEAREAADADETDT